MSLALLTVTLAQLLDLGTFVRMVALHGPSAEANPFVAQLLSDLGLPFVAIAKIAALAVVVAVIVVIGDRPKQRSHRRLAAAVVTAAVVAGVLGGWSNALVLSGGTL
jgi:hypothetical protein